ncbi:hypothetical protein ACQ4PT_035850 [Festuca glaucescens]
MAALVQLGELQLVHGDMVARQALAPAPAPAVGFQGKWSLNRKETMSRANSRWVAEEVKRRVIKNHQVGTKELQKKLKEKFKIEVPYMRAFNGKQHAMDSIYVDPAFVECFDEENEEQNDVFDTDPNNDPIEAPNDEKIDDENDDQIEDPIEAHIDDQNDDQIEAPNDEEKNDQNDDPNVVSNLLWFSVVGSNKVVAVSSEIVKVSTTKRKIEEAVSTRGTKSEVVAMSTMITRSKVVAMSTRITRSTMAKKIHE